MFDVLKASIFARQMDRDARVRWLESLLEEGDGDFIEWLESRIECYDNGSKRESYG
jgi:hypothetical protein